MPQPRTTAMSIGRISPANHLTIGLASRAGKAASSSLMTTSMARWMSMRSGSHPGVGHLGRKLAALRPHLVVLGNDARVRQLAEQLPQLVGASA